MFSLLLLLLDLLKCQVSVARSPVYSVMLHEGGEPCASLLCYPPLCLSLFIHFAQHLIIEKNYINDSIVVAVFDVQYVDIVL